MNEEQSARSTGSGATPWSDDELDVIIGRLVDDEAGDDERARFDALAAERPALRRRLDEQRGEMARLTGEFDRMIGNAAEIELAPALESTHPSSMAEARRDGGRAVLPWALAVTGWAALLAFGLAWMAGTLAPEAPAPSEGAGPQPAAIDVAPSEMLTPDDHMERYLDAGNVLGELEPVILEVEELPDGRVAVRYLRRIEEFAFLSGDDDLPVDERGYLTVDPATLRKRVRMPKPRSD